MSAEEQFTAQDDTSACATYATPAPSAPSAPPPEISRALSGLEVLRERVRANGDVAGRLRELEQAVADVRRQSSSIPVIDPAVKNAIQKSNARIEKLESVNKDLISALSSINQKVQDLERLVVAFSSITDGV